jgi:RNA polymerase sigma factor (sigma-70 family)
VTVRSPEGAAVQTREDPPDDPVRHWVRQIQAGIDVELNFSRLHQRFHTRIHSYFHAKGFRTGECEELTQEVFLHAFAAIHGFAFRATFEVWLLGIAHNLWANTIRGIRTAKRDGIAVPLQEESDRDSDERGRTASALVADGPSPEEAALRKERSAALHAAVATLPPQMRRCVLLRIEQDLKYQEIAEVLRMSIDGVKAQLGQAKVRLRALLRDEERMGALDGEDDP